jgi:predicted DNA-binding transcriptional regulator AlpA
VTLKSIRFSHIISLSNSNQSDAGSAMSEQIEAKRGPGRPRNIQEPDLPAEAVKPLRVININGIASKIGRSRTTARRLANSDPDFPTSFKLVGNEAWLEEDFDAYLRMKARRAQEAKRAKREGADDAA